jgi:hypothetical protein
VVVELLKITQPLHLLFGKDTQIAFLVAWAEIDVGYPPTI